MKPWTITGAVFTGLLLNVCVYAQQAFSGLFQETKVAHISLYAIPWEELRSKNSQLAAEGFELIDVETVVQSGKTDFYAIWRESNVPARLERASGWENLVQLKQKMAEEGFVIQALEVYRDKEGNEIFTGIWTPGKTEHKIIRAETWKGLAQQNEALGKEFFQLTDIEVLQDSWGSTTFLTIYHKGSPAERGYPLLFDNEQLFSKEKENRNKSGFPLADYETFEQGGKVQIAVLFKKDTYRENFRHRLGWTEFIASQKELGSGYYLTDLEISSGNSKMAGLSGQGSGY